MNRVSITGRLTKDPEIIYVAGTGTPICNVTVAVDKYPIVNNQDVDFIPVVVMGKRAENLAEYMSKGKLIGVEGKLQSRSYDAKDGTKRYVTEVLADKVEFLEKVNKAERAAEDEEPYNINPEE